MTNLCPICAKVYKLLLRLISIGSMDQDQDSVHSCGTIVPNPTPFVALHNNRFVDKRQRIRTRSAVRWLEEVKMVGIAGKGTGANSK